MLGRRAALPLGFGPTGFTRMMQHEGEIAVAAAATGGAGIPYALSTMGTTSIEDWPRPRPRPTCGSSCTSGATANAAVDLIARARETAGYSGLMLTVDVPVNGARLRDSATGFTFPPSLSPRTLAGIAPGSPRGG